MAPTSPSPPSPGLNYFDPTGCFCSNLIFCVTGVFQVIIVQWLDYHGLNGGSTGLTVLSSYLGLLLFAVPFTFSNRDDGAARYHPMFTVCIISDVLSNACNQLSISLCGSMLFMIIYSSIIVFSALLRWKVYGMGISKRQTQALIVITIGLLITAFDGSETVESSAAAADLFTPDAPGASVSAHTIARSSNRLLLPSTKGLATSYLTTKTGRVKAPFAPSPTLGAVADAVPSSVLPSHDPPKEESGQIVLGMVLALMGAFGYAWVYVLSEQITISKENPLSPVAFAAYGGFYGSILCSTYIVLFVGPHWTRDIVQPVQQTGTSYFSVASLYCLLLVMCGAHNLSFVYLGKNGGGAVVAGVNKAVQTISVFVISAFVFGPQHPEQRMTPYKVAALVLVVGGVLLYAGAKKETKKVIKYQRVTSIDHPSTAGGNSNGNDDEGHMQDEFGLLNDEDADMLVSSVGVGGRIKEVEMGNIRSRVG